ncbi:MAG: methionyl-tRNA formyltransferase [Bacteroidetes bacterium]|nr:MAG: methionyl-tRNA formyltransferase [Bacteroidota bacterium]
MKIVFMGTPGFARGILEHLHEEKWEIAGVITAPDRASGRGLKVNQSEVKVYAQEQGLKILQPTNLKESSFIEELKSLGADLFVVVAFRMLPEVVWQMPPKGTINLHASLLPDYRGAAPINWALINGETKTGVTTFFIEKEIDTGKVIEQESLEIGPNETAGELHDRLMLLGKSLVNATLKKIESGEAVGIEQGKLLEGKKMNSAPKIFKPMCEVDWTKDAKEVHNHCRGLSPYPTAWTTIQEEGGGMKTVKLFRTEQTEMPVTDPKNVLIQKEGIYFPCGDCYLKVSELQPEGKKRLTTQSFYAGYGNKVWKLI